MGHIRLPRLPRTRRWREVIDLIGASAGSPGDVAAATLDALADGFAGGGDDPGLIRAVWLLARLPDAAKAGSLTQALSDLGVTTTDNPTVADFIAAVSRGLERSRVAGPSDFAEMAQAAAVESLAKGLDQRTGRLFPEDRDLEQELGKLGTQVQFGRLARHFFAKFTERCLRAYIDRELPLHVGSGSRFPTLSDQRAFTAALAHHCHEAAAIVEAFAGGWWSKARYERDLTEVRAARFASYALKKMRDEMRRGALT